MNNVQLLGRLTTNPEVRYTDSGVCVTKFNLAVKRPWSKEKDGENKTDFIPCIGFNRTAELLGNGLGKGDRILITNGVLCVNTYKDKQDNLRHYTEVRINSFDYIEAKQEFGQAVEMEDIKF